MISINIPASTSVPASDARKFSPKAVPGLAFWLDAGDRKSIILDSSGKASHWFDKSGNANHAYQATAGSRPTYVDSSLNRLGGLRVLTSNKMSFENTVGNIGDFTIFRVMKNSGAFQVWNDTNDSTTSSTSTIFLAYFDIWQGYSSGITSGGNPNLASAPSNAPVVQSLRRSGTAGTFIWNGQSSSKTVLSTTGKVDIPIGNTQTSGSDYVVYETLLYNRALSDSEVAQVNAYLTARWTPPSEPPAGINPALWLDASSPSTVGLDASNNVTIWLDKSGNGNNAIQASTTLRPSGTGSINGLTALNFDGTDDFLQIANSASINLGPTLSIFIVHKTDTTSARQTLFNFQNEVGIAAVPALEVGTAPLTYDRTYCAIRPSVFMLAGPATAANTSPSVIGFLVESSAGLVLRKNGSEIATTASAGTTLVGSGLPKLIGARQSAIQPFDGEIAEILVYNTKLSGASLTNVENYLKNKWGIS